MTYFTTLWYWRASFLIWTGITYPSARDFLNWNELSCSNRFWFLTDISLKIRWNCDGETPQIVPTLLLTGYGCPVGSHCLSSSIYSAFENSITKSLVLTNPRLLLWLWDFYSPKNQPLLAIKTGKVDYSKTTNSQERRNLCRSDDGSVCSWSC